jgi:hypothetical protein
MAQFAVGYTRSVYLVDGDALQVIEHLLSTFHLKQLVELCIQHALGCRSPEDAIGADAAFGRLSWRIEIS